jgi:hypothetical protein
MNRKRRNEILTLGHKLLAGANHQKDVLVLIDHMHSQRDASRPALTC